MARADADDTPRFRPLLQTGAQRPPGALPLAGGWCWFERAEVLRRGAPPAIIAAADLPGEVRDRLTAPRPALLDLSMDRPRVMGILNITPDSFSDGGAFVARELALAHGRAMLAAGAEIIDVGGESTRPGAAEVPVAEEIARTRAVVAALAPLVPVSIDTRKAAVAGAALEAGARLVNDVSALGFDPAMAGVVSAAGATVCLMHARGTPETMRGQTAYADLLLDVYDFLEGRLAAAEAAGIARDRVVLDVGIGFAKTAAQNVALIRNLALFHGLGCPLLLGASRKRFVGLIGSNGDGTGAPRARMPGSVAVALAGVAQGVQVLRVHDVDPTMQALRLWRAVTGAADVAEEEGRE
jgi:dihydropteroate synthase